MSIGYWYETLDFNFFKYIQFNAATQKMCCLITDTRLAIAYKIPK